VKTIGSNRKKAPSLSDLHFFVEKENDTVSSETGTSVDIPAI
jgi:hypothetical protein